MLKKCNFIQLYNETYIQPHIKLILYNRIDYIIIIFFEKSSRHSDNELLLIVTESILSN